MTPETILEHCEHGRSFEVKRWLKKAFKNWINERVDLNIQNEKGQTPFSLAAKSGKIPLMDMLANMGGSTISLNHPDYHRQSPLMLAITHGQTKAALWLIDRPGVDVNQGDFYHVTPLIAAAEFGNEVVVKRLIEKGAVVNMVDLNGESAVIKAAWQGHAGIIDLLIKAGADLNLKNKQGRDALNIAVMKKHPACAEVLIRGGCHLIIGQKFDMPFRLAKMTGQKRVVNLLKDQADVLKARRRARRVASHLKPYNRAQIKREKWVGE